MWQWHYVLWGIAGAAANRAFVFLEANRRAKGRAWRYPEGPGGGYFVVACALHCGIAAIVTAAAAANHLIAGQVMALGLGVAAPAALARIGRYAVAALPPDTGDPAEPEQGHGGRDGDPGV